ncbi:MAG: hypothetical protein K0S74_1887 [Chlamydiales bacterium]|jgi:hypothetical protein|nr:hypothetical protein [Chlamydiales bacterium]
MSILQADSSSHSTIQVSPEIKQPLIESISSFDPVFEFLSDVKNDDLIVWDIDHTLVNFADNVLRWQTHQRAECDRLNAEAIAKYCRYPEDKAYLKFISSQAISHASYELTDQRLPSFIKILQSKEAKVIALTHSVTGKYGIIPDFVDWRITQLQQLDLNFSNVFGQTNQVLKFYVDENKQDCPSIYHSGILVTGGHMDKGTLLIQFLNKVNFKPRRVIFIDNKLSNLESVNNALAQQSIPCYSFLYSIAPPQVHLDVELGLFQFEYLYQNEKWLTDPQAQQMLSVYSK